MITVAKARKLLGKAALGLSEDNIQLLIDLCYSLANVMYEHFEGEESQKIDKVCRNTKLNIESQ